MPPSLAAQARSRRAVGALVLAGALAFGAGTAGAQVPTTTAPPLLVPGDTAPVTTAPAATEPGATTEAPAAEEGEDGGLLDFDLDANEKVWVIVAALVVVAIALAVLTVVYWRHTKPDRPKQDRRIERAERREEKRRRRSARRDPFAGDDDGDDDVDDHTADDAEREEPTGPLDIDELLSGPEPDRSVFASPDDPDGSPR